MAFLKSVLDMTPDEITRAEWRMVADTLRQAQQKLADFGHGHHSWINPAMDLATERGKEPVKAD